MKKKIFLAFAVMITLVAGYFLSPSAAFPPHTLITVKKGLSVSEVAQNLAERGLLRSTYLFKLVLHLLPGEATVIAGNYFFPQRAGVWDIVHRLTQGDFGLTAIRVTLQEGLSVKEMSEILTKTLPNFNSDLFLALTQKDEGYLFPDTYFILPGTPENEIVKRLRENFDKKLNPFWADFAAAPHTKEQIIVMASLLEEEARTLESKKVIAGILWKRLAEGMRLQVDAVFPYLIGKNTFEVTKSDLALDSPYNTYKYEGLPPGPITNPGLESIIAALQPEETPFWYYLSDWQGNLHFSSTFDEHKANRLKYSI